jgi:tetratricopeptide (TPR) repeat protein
MRYFFIVPFALFIFFSCGSQTTGSQSTSEPESTDSDLVIDDGLREYGDYSKLQSLEPYFGSDMEFDDPAKAQELLRETDEFVSKYPDDKRAPIALYRAAGVAKNQSDWLKAMQYFERTWKNYPSSFVAPMALFLHGFILDDTLNNDEEALKLYQLFEERYPTNQFMPDVKKLMDMITMSQEELLDKLKEQNKFQQY